MSAANGSSVADNMGMSYDTFSVHRVADHQSSCNNENLLLKIFFVQIPLQAFQPSLMNKH